VRAARIALDVHDLALDRVHQGGATDRAVGTDAGGGLGVLDPQLLSLSHRRRQARTDGSERAERRTRQRPATGCLEEVAACEVHDDPLRPEVPETPAARI